jgi:transcriptional regulator GlxA family with amidase domain
VASVVSNRLSPFEFAVTCEVFGIDRSHLGVPWYRFLVCSADPSPVTTEVGFSVEVPYGIEALRRADTVVVPAPGRLVEPNPVLLDELCRAHDRGARILSVCTGAFVLAAAGLLDGRRATTHWSHAEELARRYPKVRVDPNVLYVEDGDIFTSAGTAAGIDLCLHVVRLDFGAEVANTVARAMVVPPHRDGGQAQFIDVPVPSGDERDSLAATLRWAMEHLSETLSVDELASRSSMSPRTFARRFRAQVGTTPHQWLSRQRILLAQRLLETTDLAVDLVADRCGLGTAANLRLHFHRIVRTTPQAYRHTFRQEAS